MTKKLVMMCLECEEQKPVKEFGAFSNMEICNICLNEDKYHINIDTWEFNIYEVDNAEFYKDLLNQYVLPEFKEYLKTMDGKIITIYLGDAYLIFARTTEIGYVPVFCADVGAFVVCQIEEDKSYETGDYIPRTDILQWMRRRQCRKYANDVFNDECWNIYEETDMYYLAR